MKYSYIPLEVNLNGKQEKSRTCDQRGHDSRESDCIGKEKFNVRAKEKGYKSVSEYIRSLVAVEPNSDSKPNV